MAFHRETSFFLPELFVDGSSSDSAVHYFFQTISVFSKDSRAMHNHCIDVNLLSPCVSSVSDQEAVPSKNMETLDSMDTI